MIFVTALSLVLNGEIKNQIDIWRDCQSEEEAKTRSINSPNNQPFILSGYRIIAFSAAQVPLDFILADRDVIKLAQEQFAKEAKP